MALDRKDEPGSSLPEFELRDDDRFTGYEAEDEGSHFGAFLMGGMLVAGGLLAFVYYDTDNLNGRAQNDLTTGSISRSNAPAPVPSLKLSNPAQTDTETQNKQ
ncbi:hypothetical protein [Enterovirga sp. CN4-39]|uniref:hypothetical protein n=1 Tax=Enterovirga sp. CN4-39 TaxID=3400910 RepID=UPI003C010D68